MFESMSLRFFILAFFIRQHVVECKIHKYACAEIFLSWIYRFYSLQRPVLNEINFLLVSTSLFKKERERSVTCRFFLEHIISAFF